MSDDLMKTRLEGDRVIIELPLSLLRWSQEHRDDPIYIMDEQKMGEYVRDQVLETGYDAECGATTFTNMLDNLFTDALENGETWCQGWWEDEEGEE
jgi:hypothetical protein